MQCVRERLDVACRVRDKCILAMSFFLLSLTSASKSEKVKDVLLYLTQQT